LIFDNYSKTAGPSPATPATSCSDEVLVKAQAVGISDTHSMEEELGDLRRQLRDLKKQSLIVMEQSRKSSDREKAAFQQVEEARKLKDAAQAEAAKSASREEYMLQLLSDASEDIAGMLLRQFLYVLSL
jgi:TolA-binding protein